MISLLVGHYIRKKAKRRKNDLPLDYRKILSDVVVEYKKRGIRLVFSWIWAIGCKLPNASATIPGLILVNPEWAYQLVMHHDDELVTDAFKMTMGHEITHQKKDYSFFNLISKDERFVYWVNEVHADFGGIVWAFDGNMYKGLRVLEYKCSWNRESDKDSWMHPSWKRRIDFISNYDFDERLIRKIADITGVSNQKLIAQVVGYYEDIVLKRNTGGKR